ncbi:MAG: DUF4823 domain-containing protein [Pseudomonas sp.]|jgi:hypothetical protein|uniref:DUF4823 domain-containing protein n=1 Tax=Pseudomonas sp. TaxID=306 RepID=UPI003982B596
MRSLLLIVGVVLLSGCMKASDLADEAIYQLRDVGVLDHSQTRRASPWRLQADSFIYIAQGHFVPPGSAYPRPNVVAEEAYKGFIEYFPMVRRAKAPLGLEESLTAAREAGAHYLLYSRFAYADDRIGTVEEWEDQEALDRLGTDRGVIQLMLIETNTRYLVDTTRIRSRGGFLTLYDAKPEDLIGPALQDYARRLIGLGH